MRYPYIPPKPSFSSVDVFSICVAKIVIKPPPSEARKKLNL